MHNFFKLAPTILAVCLFSLMTGCGHETIKGEGAAKQEQREIKAFSGIEIDGNYAILGTIGKPDELVISSNPNILPHIKSSVDSGILIIKNDDSVNLKPSVAQKIWFTTEEFQSLRLSGNSQFQIELNSNKLDCEFKGSHKALLKGKLASLKIVSNGSADINAQGLQVKNAEVEINGSGLVTLSVTDNLKVKINGDGKVIYYSGQPKVEQSISGSGQVRSAFGALEKQQQ